MTSTVLTLLSGILGIFWSVKARNAFTRFTGVLLAISTLFSTVSYAGVQKYAFYAVAFFCLMSAYEPVDSKRIKKRHRAYFGASGFLMALVTLDTYLQLPFTLTLWPFAVIFILITVWLIVQEPKMIRTRLGYISVWLGLAIICLINTV